MQGRDANPLLLPPLTVPPSMVLGVSAPLVPMLVSMGHTRLWRSLQFSPPLVLVG